MQDTKKIVKSMLKPLSKGVKYSIGSKIYRKTSLAPGIRGRVGREISKLLKDRN